MISRRVSARSKWVRVSGAMAGPRRNSPPQKIPQRGAVTGLGHVRFRSVIELLVLTSCDQVQQFIAEQVRFLIGDRLQNCCLQGFKAHLRPVHIIRWD